MHHQINKLLAMAIQGFEKGNLDEVEGILQQVLKIQPKNFDALHIYGVVKGLKNQHKEALGYFRKALRIDPNNSFLNFNVAKAFSEIGDDDKAIKYHVSAMGLNPGHPEGWLNYGRSLLNLKKYEESLECNDKAIALNPKYADAWVNRGCVLHELARYKEALNSFDEALKINSDLAEAWSSRGNTLNELKQYGQAITSCDKAISIKPDYAEAWSNRGVALCELKQHEEALASYAKAVSINPDCAEAWCNRGVVFLALAQYEQALASCDRALDIKPDYVEAWSNKGIALTSIGKFQLAEASLREAIKIDPSNIIARSKLLFNLNYFEYDEMGDGLAEAKNYGSVVSKKSIPKFAEWDVSFSTKKLRIGFVSGDLVNHPVGYFVEGLFEHIDPSQFELYAFPTAPVIDDLTNRILPFFKEWVPVYGMSDLEAATVIHQKGIHILFDLSGHTAHSRLPIFSYKPSPVQVTWLGYFSTTGLPEMDYVLGDPYMSPFGEEKYFTEAIWNLAETWMCLKPPEFKFSVPELPALRNGYLTFGSFGNLSKLNDKVVGVWASVLHQVSASKLFLKSNQLREASQIENVRRRFEKFGISAERLIIEGPDLREVYYEAYSRVDFVLDTFPYPGGTTSIDALWMGVPVLTLKGTRFLSRLGESIATNAGNLDWIAEDVDDYVKKAVEFSSDIERLSHFRSSLRERVLGTALFDTARFAENFGSALWGMWDKFSKVALGDQHANLMPCSKLNRS